MFATYAREATTHTHPLETTHIAPQLEVPPVILGYHSASGRPPSLSALITLRPRLAAPGPPDEERVSGEQEDVFQHAQR